MNSVKLHNLQADCLIKTIQIEEGPAWRIQIPERGDRLFTGFTNKMVLWDLNTGLKLAEFEESGQYAVMTPDDKTAVSSDGKKSKCGM